MAAFSDLALRLERTIQRDARLHCESIYRAQPLPGWLAGPWADTIGNAGEQTPVLLVNVKGSKVADALCILKLADLERLVRLAQVLERLAGPDTAEMLGDAEIGEAALFDLERSP